MENGLFHGKGQSRTQRAAAELLLASILAAPAVAQAPSSAPLPVLPTVPAAAPSGEQALRDSAKHLNAALTHALTRIEQLSQGELERFGGTRELRLGAYPTQARELGRIPLNGDVFSAYAAARKLAVEQPDVRIWLVAGDVDFPGLAKSGARVLTSSKTAEFVVVANDALARAIRLGLVGLKEVAYRPEESTRMGEDIQQGQQNYPSQPTGIEGLAMMRVAGVGRMEVGPFVCGTSMLFPGTTEEPRVIHQNTEAEATFLALGFAKGESKGKVLGGEDYAVFAHLDGVIVERQLPPFHPNEEGKLRAELALGAAADSVLQVITVARPSVQIVQLLPELRRRIELEERRRAQEIERRRMASVRRAQSAERLQQIEREDAAGPKLLRRAEIDVSIGRDPKNPTQLGAHLPTEAMQKRLERYHRWLIAKVVQDAISHDADTQRALKDVEQAGGPIAEEVLHAADGLAKGLSERTLGYLKAYYHRAIASASEEGREELRAELAALERDIAEIDAANEPQLEGESKYPWSKFKTFSAPARRVLPEILKEWIREMGSGR